MNTPRRNPKDKWNIALGRTPGNPVSGASSGAKPVTSSSGVEPDVDRPPQAAPNRPTAAQVGGTAPVRPSPQANAAGSAGAAQAAAQKIDPPGPDNKGERKGIADSWVMQNKGLVIGGLAAGTIAAMALSAADASGETVRTIIKVEPAETGEFFANKKRVKITYSPDIEIVPKDSITISGSKTTPNIDGSTSISKDDIVSNGSIIITASAELTGFEPGGTITVSTGFLNHASSITGQTAGAVGSAVGEVTGETLGAAGGGIGELFSGIFGGLGIWAWVGLAVLVLFLFKR